jgi:hypothetical protein
MAALFQQLGKLDEEKVKRLPNLLRSVIVETLERTIDFPIVTSLQRGKELYAPAPYDDFVKLFRPPGIRHDVAILTFTKT